MPRANRRRKRPKGNIEQLRSGALRVRVYAGIDPVSKRRHYLTETVPAGDDAWPKAERVLTRFVNQVDEKRNPRTSATLNQLLDRWLEIIDVEASTRRGYLTKINKHIRPVLGPVSVSRLDTEILESFYADLRRCRDHCSGRKHQVQHRTTKPHACDQHPRSPCNPPDPGCKHCRRMCKPHACRPLSDSSIRACHWILNSAFERAVRWKWLAVNPATPAEPPSMPRPDPQPPTVEEAARLVEAAISRDPDWGTFVWLAMTTGARRGEICAVRWSHVDLKSGVVSLRRALFKDDKGKLSEKDTKTHQQRRIVLDPETAAVLREHYERCRDRAEQLELALKSDAYVFSLEPDGSAPLIPDSVTQRYDRMAKSLDIRTTLHRLRHYSATELISAGVDVRTVAGRLGHGGGGATTLRVYAAWTAEADQRAASTLSGRMPVRAQAAQHGESASEPPAGKTNVDAPRGPYEQIANDLRSAIACGALQPGDQLPAVKDLANRYEVATGTAHRAVALLATEGAVEVGRGRRATVIARYAWNSGSPQIPRSSFWQQSSGGGRPRPHNR